jgi:hypothetical protein
MKFIIEKCSDYPSSDVHRKTWQYFISLHFVMKMKNETGVFDYENSLGVEAIEKRDFFCWIFIDLRIDRKTAGVRFIQDYKPTLQNFHA